MLAGHEIPIGAYLLDSLSDSFSLVGEKISSCRKTGWTTKRKETSLPQSRQQFVVKLCLVVNSRAVVFFLYKLLEDLSELV